MDNDNRNLPRDVFFQLLGIVTLYVSAISLITLFFQYINVLFPDVVNRYYDYVYLDAAGPIRWAMASLMIFFPVYLLMTKTLNADYDQHPEKREFKLRKWLVYFTLFITALAIIIDLVSLIYNFLGGELTVRFALKVLTVLAVAGTVFGYYSMDLRNKLTKGRIKAMAWGSLIFVFGSIIAGFFTVGSPFNARLYKLDGQRINDLQVLQGEIVNYWQLKNKLPPSLADLKDDIRGFVPPVDPETAHSYEYAVRGPLKFELCANFSLPADDASRAAKMPAAYPYDAMSSENWNHSEGRQCFERTIDPERYKPGKPVPF